MNKRELLYYLKTENERDITDLFRTAYQIKTDNVGNTVYLRGLIEFSNICDKNCYYCGIRHDNRQLERYFLKKEEILEAARQAVNFHYGSVVLQSGECRETTFTTFVDDLVREIKGLGPSPGVTLCTGEQSYAVYKQWFDAGAHRYLLRIETSNRDLYSRLHPSDHSFEKRLHCLEMLKNIGYQVGTGFLIGAPGQTLENLAGDLLFLKKFDIDMIGMGPFLPHPQTIYATKTLNMSEKKKRFLLSLKMIALCRILLKDVNIASTTALQALDPQGREKALQVGANVIMPTLTPSQYRPQYLLYEGKPCITDSASDCRTCLTRRITAFGEKIGWDQWGDSPHFFNRTQSRVHD